MIFINNKILITVHYLVEDEKGDFWDRDTGYLNKQIKESLEKQFPGEVKLSAELCATRYSLRHQPIDYSNANIIECPICKCLVTDKTKPRSIRELDGAKELDGVMMCSSCAWEQSFDIKKHKIITGKPPLPDGALIIQSNEDKLFE